MEPSEGKKYRHELSSSSFEMEGGRGQVVLERRDLYVWKVDGEVDDVLGRTTRQIIAQRSRGVLLTFSGADSEERWAQRTSGCWTILVDGGGWCGRWGREGTAENRPECSNFTHASNPWLWVTLSGALQQRLALMVPEFALCDDVVRRPSLIR
jgi:hypothetical protein